MQCKKREHQNRQVEYICSCAAFLCSKCAIYDHQNHKYKEIGEFIQEMRSRDKIKIAQHFECQSELKQFQADLEVYKKQFDTMIRTSITQFENEFKNKYSQKVERFERIISLLNKSDEQLINDFDSLSDLQEFFNKFDNHVEDLENSRTELQENLQMIKINTLNELLAKCNKQLSQLQSTSPLKQQLQRGVSSPQQSQLFLQTQQAPQKLFENRGLGNSSIISQNENELINSIINYYQIISYDEAHSFLEEGFVIINYPNKEKQMLIKLILRFEGSLKNGLRNGFGVYTFEDDNQKFVGYYQNDQKEGLGFYYDQKISYKFPYLNQNSVFGCYSKGKPFGKHALLTLETKEMTIINAKQLIQDSSNLQDEVEDLKKI